jgi:hypothetical protein
VGSNHKGNLLYQVERKKEKGVKSKVDHHKEHLEESGKSKRRIMMIRLE